MEGQRERKMASQVRRVARLEHLSQEQLTSGGELLETAGARGSEDGNGDEAEGLDPVVPSAWKDG